ncbi:MAG: AEC family transporter [Candidatus Tectomicrobia bacterium]|uniref:AEC family transporter n=1 Tax=Tectimicrobiota bacterium TaxID=2528274 RepID=A0A932HYI4_UNCTE|nr:AEC family transporter [Candidatus Tectomicrobia bacterium]
MAALLRVAEIMFPVLALMGAGFTYGRWRKLDPRFITDLILFLMGPALMFDALARQRFDAGELIRAMGFSLAIQLIPGAAALAVRRAAGIRSRAFVPSVMIMNTVSLPYPLALLAFGEAGLAQVVLLSIPNVFIVFTLGIMLHGGRSQTMEPLRMPSLYASGAGILVSMLALPVPAFLLSFTHIAGRGMFPLELFALGYRLRSIRISDLRLSLFTVGLRFGLGFLTAWGIARVFALEETARAALFLVSCSPPAILNYIFAERYGQEGPLAASIVFTGTAASLLTTPLVLLYLQLA